MRELRLYYLKTETVKEQIAAVRAALSPAELTLADRFLREEDRLLSLGGAWLIRRFGPPPESISRNAAGKPISREKGFNLSHSEDMAGLAVGDFSEVGLDLEKDRPGYDDLADHVLSREEKASGLPFLVLFTAKEALVKARGTGLGDEPREIPALPLNGPVVFEGERYFRHSFQKNEYFVSAAVKGGDFAVREESIHVIQ